MEQRFVVRKSGENERRGFPLRLRNALRRVFTHAVERTALRNAAPFLAAAYPNQQPPPSDRVSLLTTPRFNHLAIFVPVNAPVPQILAVNELLVRWYATVVQHGYSFTPNDTRWKIYVSTMGMGTDVVTIAYFGSNQLFNYIGASEQDHGGA